MRLPIVLTLLVLFLLPADLNSFAATLNTQYGAATSAIAGFFDRNEDDDSTIEVASVPRREITPGTPIR